VSGQISVPSSFENAEAGQQDIPKDAVPFLHVRYTFTDFIHLTGDISTTDVGVLLQEDA
jgi:hypothetical protein